MNPNDDSRRSQPSSDAGARDTEATVVESTQQLRTTLPDFAAGSVRRFGHYQILKELGRGGQGVVFLAEDERLNRRVALKVLTSGGLVSENAVARFRREARVASRLTHPNICAVYEADVVDGLPFIAMSYVEGETLSRKLTSRRLVEGRTSVSEMNISLTSSADSDLPGDREQTTSSPPTRNEISELCRLFEKAARAVHYANENGVVHRDIKPGNIMVTDQSEPVILDFGLAIADDDEARSITRTGDVFGTPVYMSPEQVSGSTHQVDRRTDVYSLGATLYEALTLQLPFSEPTRHALFEAIQTRNPTDVRLVNPEVSSDLAVIVQTALEKKPEHRYQTAGDLAEDLRRLLEHLPILARPVGPLTRAWLWAERHVALALTLCGLFLSISIGLVVSLISLNQAKDALEGQEEALRKEKEASEATFQALNRERQASEAAQLALQRERSAREEADVAADFLTNAIRMGIPEETTHDVRLRDVLDIMAARVANEFTDKPLVQARLDHSFSVTYISLGIAEASERHAQRAMDTRRKLLGPSHIDSITSQVQLARALFMRTDLISAEELLNEADELLGDSQVNGSRKVRELIKILRTKIELNHGRFDRAAELTRGLIAESDADYSEDSYDSALRRDDLAFILGEQRKYAEAIPLMEKAVAVRERLIGRPTPGSLKGRADIARWYQQLAQRGTAVEMMEKVNADLVKYFPEQHLLRSDLLWRHAMILTGVEEHEEALKLHQEALDIRRGLFSRPHRDTATSLESVGEALFRLGRVDDAEPFLVECLEMRRTLFGEGHVAVASSLDGLAKIAHRRKDFPKAIQLTREALGIWERELGVSSADYIICLGRHALHLQDGGELSDSEECYRRSLALWIEHWPDRMDSISSARHTLGANLFRVGKTAEAEALTRQALKERRELPETPRSYLLESLGNLAVILETRNELKEAEGLLRESVDLSRAGGASWITSLEGAKLRLAANLVKQKRFDEAEELIEDVLDEREERLPANAPEIGAARKRLDALRAARLESASDG